MSTRRSPAWAPTFAWRTFCLLTLAALGWAGWRLLGETPYRIDIDVYRMGGRAWLDGSPLYADGAMFATQGGLELPFTYPPLAAIVFSPFAVMPLPAASAVITATTLLLLVVALVIVLTRLDVWPATRVTAQPAWLRRTWLAAAIVAPAVLFLEPIRANFDFGQINVVLMTLVIADCLPRRTPWPRGMLVGLAIALKLTPAVFLLYFLLRRDTRALLVSAASVVVLMVLGFALAWRDSWEYWTATVRNTDRIGAATLNTNQNIAGTLARLGVGEDLRFALWALACFAVLGLTVWAGRRALRADEPVLALVCVAMFGLVVSPVSWSHHWVWSLPTVLVTLVVAHRTRHLGLAVAGALGFALTVWSPITLLPEHRETSASLWRQLAGGSYVWWALLVIAAAGTLTARATHRPEPVRAVQPAAASGSRAAG
ncbi:alpha-(1-2)-phosphatidylinositol mannosyltransferase [Mycobacterium sp. IS-1742]|uniref:glycosyltransferase 87 family protein n=1 Tax=Mycobacterium sp. IS-1742 TaxID=1772285 RepID=UPI00073FFB2F|nr:glycosyltransferase 87 family protein [Mycobacterium sp. IS-1742]KUI29745.1 alpha-(1-2)-phosphatidylinositol mannosyltransferase [Mycobacterium sp. IS-1742]